MISKPNTLPSLSTLLIPRSAILKNSQAPNRACPWPHGIYGFCLALLLVFDDGLFDDLKSGSAILRRVVQVARAAIC